MKTILKNLNICVGADNGKIKFISDGQIHVDGNRILYAGKESDAPQFVADKIVDADGALAMPGMNNIHTHTPMTLLRSVGGNLSLEDWLNKAIFPREAKLSDDLVYIASILGIMEMLRYGTCNFCDMYMHMGAEAKAVRDFKMRATLTHGSVSFDGSLDDYYEGLKFALDWNNKEEGRIKTGLAPHSCYLTTESLLTHAASDARKYNLPIHIHVSETKVENKTVMDRFNSTPVELLNKVGALENRVIAAHCVWLSDSDIDIVKNKNFHVAHNPISNLKLASGIAPVAKFLQNGINVGIGTDGVASNNNLNLWEEMRAMPLLQKGITGDPTLISPYETLYAATVAGAKALGYDDLGLIKKGYIADLFLVDMNNASSYPSNSLEDDIVYALQGADVKLTMVDGNILYENGEYPGFNKKEIFAEAIKAAKALN